jgi:hypothetical protein
VPTDDDNEDKRVAITARTCEHCGQKIPYRRGRILTICQLCQLRGHKDNPETCVECEKLDEYRDNFDTEIY